MGIQREIGWGEKENLLYDIYKKIKRANGLGYKWTQGDFFQQGSLLNQIPTEVSDPLNFGRWVYSDDSNKRDDSDYIYQLRDISKNNAIGDELMPYPDFSNSTGWSLSASAIWDIVGGKLTGTAGTSSGNAVYGACIINAVYKIDYDIESITDSYIQESSLFPREQMYDALSVSNEYNAMSDFVGFRKPPQTVCLIDNFSVKRIIGNHLTQSSFTESIFPKVLTGGIEFDGVDDYMLTAVTADAVGSIYVVAQRIGTDADYVVLNSLTGIGEISGGVFYLGRNAAGTAYYNIRIKEILIRPSVDEAARITAINNYYTKLLSA